MSKIYLWPDGTYLDASEYDEAEFRHNGDDYMVIDLQALCDGKAVIMDPYKCPSQWELQRLRRAKLQLEAVTTMFRNYRDFMRKRFEEVDGKFTTASAVAVEATEQQLTLEEENRQLKSRLAGATARIRKQIDGYDAQAKLAEWKGRAEAAEAELAKLKRTAAIAIATLQEIE